MAAKGRSPVPFQLKVISGGNTRPSRHRAEPVVEGVPAVPPFISLSPEERACFDWLVARALPGIHGERDSVSFALAARLLTQFEIAAQKVHAHGHIMRGPSNRPELQPYFRALRDLSERCRLSLAELGFSPSARLKIIPPGSGAPKEQGWDEID